MKLQAPRIPSALAFWEIREMLDTNVVGKYARNGKSVFAPRGRALVPIEIRSTFTADDRPRLGRSRLY